MHKYLLFLLLAAVLCLNAQNKTTADSDNWNASILRPGDVLRIEVFRVEEFTRLARIEEDGTFYFPLCGHIAAAGFTPKDIAQKMTVALSKQISNPQVSVLVESWSPRNVYILGEVMKSMSLPLPTYGRLTAIQALSEAGGLTEKADMSNVAVLRKDNKTGKITRIPVDVSPLQGEESAAKSVRLCPEDTLVVPAAPPVYISGAATTGMYYINTKKPPLCSEFILRAGGMAQTADLTNIVIFRSAPKGKRKGKEIIHVSLRRANNGLFENDVRLQAGDYIHVNMSNQIYVLGQVKTPGPLTLLPGRSVTASQAIALAGGFTELAKERDVTLIRGKELRSLNLHNLYDSIENMKRDVDLQDGDILFVKESIF